MAEKQEGLEAGEILDELELEVPTAAYRVGEPGWRKLLWGEKQLKIESNYDSFKETKKASEQIEKFEHKELVTREKMREALVEAVQQAREQERRRILEKIREVREKLQHRVDVALEEKENAEEDSWAEKRSIERINNYDLSQRKIQKLVEELEEEVEIKKSRPKTGKSDNFGETDK